MKTPGTIKFMKFGKGAETEEWQMSLLKRVSIKYHLPSDNIVIRFFLWLQIVGTSKY